MKLNNKGFTLVELIVVIAILGVLAAVLAPQYIQYVEKSKQSADVQAASTIEQAMNVLCADGAFVDGDTVTWTTGTTGTIALLPANVATLQKLTDILGKTAIPTKSTNAKDAISVTFAVTVTNSVPKVTVTATGTAGGDYHSWKS